ncbi:hypothetical protein SAY87_000208 [Trapa incisa]|uniref:Uncharacterized protein n=1 Tax=Trapa incisa TaxID=236973 RepID=A0AAN7JGF9_9MYRT|nr:hypothetical protein SAY87_000208 [Trapa incisa]
MKKACGIGGVSPINGGSATGDRAAILLLILVLTMVATLIYTISTDGLPFRRDLLTLWMAETPVDYCTVLFPIVVIAASSYSRDAAA